MSRDGSIREQQWEKALSDWGDRFSDPKGQAAEAFVRLFFGQLAAEDIESRPAEELLQAALSLWHFGEQRPVGESLIRIFGAGGDDGEAPWAGSATIIELVNDDMPFLVDSVVARLGEEDLDIHLLVHPILEVRRSDDGERTVGEGEPIRESFIQVHVDRLSETRAGAILDSLSGMLANVRAAVEDWLLMRRRLRELVAELESSPPPLPPEDLAESLELLRWLDQDHFTFLGYREYDFEGDEDDNELRAVAGSGLGILRDAFRERPAKPKVLSAETVSYALRPELLILTKSDSRSVIHRPVLMDYVGIKKLAEDGSLLGEYRFIGLFTSLAYHRRADTVPVLRRKVGGVLERAGFDPASHDGKSLVHILETFPRDELFRISGEDLFAAAMKVLGLQERRRLALMVRPDRYGRFVSCLIYLPRDQYNTVSRERMQQILAAAFDGHLATHYAHVGDDPYARLQLVFKTTPGQIPDFDESRLEAQLSEACLTWNEQMLPALEGVLGDDRAARALHRRYAEAFTAAYQDAFSPAAATYDVRKVEDVLATQSLRLSLYRPTGFALSRVRFKIYQPGEPVPLSRIVPWLEMLGFRVVSERPYAVRPEGVEKPVWIRDLELEGEVGDIDLDDSRERLTEAFEKVWDGEAESDGFNRLVLGVGLSWRQVVILRAYFQYLRQTGFLTLRGRVTATLAAYPGLCRRLIEIFETRFDPELIEGRDEAAQALVESFESDLEEVRSLDEDRIFRRFSNLVLSTLRTNYYQVSPEGRPKSYLSFKLDASRLLDLPEPRPRFEIFVYSPRFEGVHLRGGAVARGGIRWSDRREDFRTEILGLLKAQMVKNAVIVPVGAKGGFVLKEAPVGDPAALRTEGEDCYRIFVRGLLDLTDNRMGDEVVPPPRLVRHDGDDPYLVVAADKGTATFSDLANEISAEYSFWLGDAFASGGSVGYDHKKMGITARGAWEAVKRHFRELGTDIQNEPFEVVGVGDMSGDVFGNGMLLSEQTRLVGAFNHLHIFLDPNPDPAVSYAERARLFALPRSTWKDYDETQISTGGGVFERSSKSIPLSPEIRALLGLDVEEASPDEVIRALLKAPADLLWFGGIGTFVKSSKQSHRDAGDLANDALRVDARELRVKVVGEGANLGLTQAARVEFSLGGGLCNTDAIDNSGGVGCSDREVNIKVLLDGVVAAGELPGDERNQLLAEMTEEVAELVLRDNYLQTQAITVACSQGAAALDKQAQMIRELERAGKLDRELEGLPDAEAINARQAAGGGMMRPETAVLLAYSKITLFEEILDSDLPDDPYFAADLRRYFPEPLRERFADGIERHRLRREIVATTVTNSLVNRVGPTFFSRLSRATGKPASAIARAYTAAREIFEMRDLWGLVEELDNRTPAEVQTRMIVAASRLLERSTLWLLRHSEVAGIEANVERYHEPVMTLSKKLEGLLPATDASNLKRRQAGYQKKGAPKDLARRVATFEILLPALEISRLAGELGRPVEEAARTYFVVGARFGIDWLRGAAGRLNPTNPWQRAAREATLDQLFVSQGELTSKVLECGGPEAGAQQALRAWIATRPGLAGQTRALLKEVRRAGSLELSMLNVATHQLRTLIDAVE